MKNKNLIIGLVVLVIVLVGGYFLFVKKSAQQTEPTAAVPAQEEVMALTSQDIGLTLTASVDKHKVTMEVAKTSDLTSLDYELAYTSTGGIPRGVLGNIDATKTKGATIKKDMLLGTCSDVCHYDQGVTSVNLTLKVTKTDGKIYSVVQSLPL